jgi:tetratricopeptide (TPR) repeat protein
MRLFERWNSWLAGHSRWAVTLVCLPPFAVFGGTLAGQFVFDDIPQVLQNPFVTNAKFWSRIFLGSVWSFRGGGEHDNFYRPLQFLTYWLLYRAGGPHPALFHLFQLLLCIAIVWLVYRLGRELLGNELAAFAGALLWGLHPQHVETVAWVSALPDAGVACFSLWAFLLFLRAEHAADARLTRYSVAALAYLPALFFKESALSFPLLLLVYWFFLPGGSTWKHKTIRWLPFAAAAAVYLAIRISILGNFSQGAEAFRITRQMFAVALGLLGQHAKLFFWPVHLSAFRVFDLTRSLHSFWPWVVLLALALALLARRREPILGFLVFWWAVTLLPCLDIRMVSFPLADRFSYLPSVGLSLALAYTCLVRLPRLFRQAQVAAGLAGLLALGSIAYAVQDVRLVPTWRNNDSLWTYSFHASPDAALTHLFQARLLQIRDGNLDGAAEEYRTALRLNQSSARPLVGVAYEGYLGLGQIALIQGRTAEAVNLYEDAVRLAPNHSPAYKSLGAAYFPHGDYKKAAEYFAVAVRLNPQDVESRFYLGTCALKLGEPRQAAAQFRAARQVDPTYVEAYDAEARALDVAGDKDEAARVRAMVPKR